MAPDEDTVTVPSEGGAVGFHVSVGEVPPLQTHGSLPFSGLCVKPTPCLEFRVQGLKYKGPWTLSQGLGQQVWRERRLEQFYGVTS